MTQLRQPTPSQRLTEAFHWIAVERNRGATTLPELIRRAQERFALTPDELTWIRWSLDPKSVAVAPKEPDRS
jgi:hypothetical protein